MRYTRRNRIITGNRLIVAAMLSGLAGFALLGMRNEARACGGLFCNARPPDPFAPLPVAQNGENVVFSITKDPAGGAPTLQAHIQILYTGDAAKFSWVVPVDAAPVLSTGTDRLFSALASVTQPRFQTSSQISGTCIPQGVAGTTGAAGTFGGTGSAGTTGASGAGGSTGGVMVQFQGAVGPFDAAVIKSDDSVELRKWLTDNGYVVSDQAVGLIDTYVSEDKYFVALKLLNGVGVRSIQPIILTFKGVEACVPLRLTAIAANPNMPVLVWVLGDERVAPRGFYELKIDEMRINWLSGGTNYFGPTGLVSLAANEAGGKAFVTEYAGVSTIASMQVYRNGQFNMAALQQAQTPPAYVQQLISMGLTSDPLMLPLLAKYIPMPDALKTMGVTESQFYNGISGYWAQYAFPPYDLPGLTAAISTSIVMPRYEAQAMIDAHPYLTRLNTFISPEEMDRDPFFFEAKDLKDVSNVHTAVLRTMCGNMEYLACNAPIRLELPDGQMAWVRAGSTATSCKGTGYDVVDLDKLPATEVAWQREDIGEGMRVMDNTSMIASAVATHNAKFAAEQTRFPIPSGAAGSGGGGAGGRGGSGGGPVGGSGGGPVGGMGGTGPLGTGGLTGTGGMGHPIDEVPAGGGCGCDVGGAGAGAISLATLLGAFALLVTRRRRRVFGAETEENGSGS
jgi:MYXO-CTERM domain-containing protein